MSLGDLGLAALEGAPAPAGPEPLHDTALRVAALSLAVRSIGDVAPPALILDTAKKFHAWLAGGAS